MPWPSLVPPTAGTVVTVAWANAQVIAPLQWLRQLAGNADPPGASYVVVSTSGSASSWQKVPQDAIADGAVADVKLANQKVNAATSLFTSFTAVPGANRNGFFEVSPGAGGPTGVGAWHVLQGVETNQPSTYYMQLTCDINNQNELYFHLAINGVVGAWRKMWHAGNQGAGSGLDADLLDGQQGTYYATAAALAAVAAVPSGMIAAFANAGAIPAGWSRYSAGDGRLLIGDGTTYGQTFSVSTPDVGTSWAHSHSVTGNTGASTTGGGAVQGGGGSSADPQGHVHSPGGLAAANQTWTPVARVVVWAQKT